jgi:hypothetical protein
VGRAGEREADAEKRGEESQQREGAVGGRKDGRQNAGTGASTASTDTGGARAGKAGVRVGGARGGRGPGRRAEGGGRSPKPEMLPRISDASKWVRGIGCEQDERGAKDGKDAKEGGGSAGFSPNVQLETCGGVRRHPDGDGAWRLSYDTGGTGTVGGGGAGMALGGVGGAKPTRQRRWPRCASRARGCWGDDIGAGPDEGGPKMKMGRREREGQMKGSACVGRAYEDHVEDVAAGALGTRGLGGEGAGVFRSAGSHTCHGRPQFISLR